MTRHHALHWSDKAPPVAAFIEMRAACGWGRVAEDTARRALSAGQYNVCVHAAEDVAGFGRVVGDGALYFYLQDIVVAPPFRDQGLGSGIIRRLLDQIRADAPPGSMVGLMAATGAETLYSRFGFMARPDAGTGPGMTLIL